MTYIELAERSWVVSEKRINQLAKTMSKYTKQTNSIVNKMLPRGESNLVEIAPTIDEVMKVIDDLSVSNTVEMRKAFDDVIYE